MIAYQQYISVQGFVDLSIVSDDADTRKRVNAIRGFC